jgi:hypothetical protein
MPEGLNLAAIESELSSEDLEETGRMAWLEDSYQNSENFWNSVKTTNDSFFKIPGKSIPYQHYDFYHDIIIRNQPNNPTAFCWYDSASGWHKVSYAELGALASKKAAAWINSGVQPGDTLCIVYPLGIQLVISMLAAFKIGLKISILPPLGKKFIKKRIENVSPDHIDSDLIFFPMLKPWESMILPEIISTENSKADTENSYSYLSGTVIGLCLNPSSPTPHIPRELTCDAAYLYPMRDGILALGLRPGQIVAAPGFHFLEYYPALILSALLNGATFLHIEPEDIKRKPELLTDHPVRSMGISTRIRDILVNHPITIDQPWNRWFRNPSESYDINQWQHFIKTLKIEDISAVNLKWDAALGGCSLFSSKIKGKAHLRILPSAGISWSLMDPAGSDQESFTDYGVFSVSPAGQETDDQTATSSLITRNGNEWLFTGSSVAGRSGRHYPVEEVLETIQEIPNCSLCSMAKLPAPRMAGDHIFILLVFTNNTAGVDEAKTVKEIRNTLVRDMGEEFLPDRILFYPLYPRRDPDNKIDHEWCHSQFITGGLLRKSKDELYHCITMIREHTFLT